MTLSNSEAREFLKTGKLPGRQAAKRNKYNAVKKEYNGRLYDSMKEADYAAQLDLLIKAGEVKKWEPQFKIELTSEGQHICFYLIDFKVWFTDDRIEYHEVKGKETDLWRTKWKMSKAQYPDWNFKLIK